MSTIAPFLKCRTLRFIIIPKEVTFRQPFQINFEITSQVMWICSICHSHNPVLHYFLMINNKNNTKVSISGAEIASQSEIPEFISALLWDSYCSIFIFLCSLLQIVVFLFSVFVWPLYCLFSFDLRLLNTPFSKFLSLPQSLPTKIRLPLVTTNYDKSLLDHYQLR